MIGFYNYTVILTYMSLLSAMIGMTFATTGHYKMAVFCLALSGFFDMFDGKVARRKLDRTDDEKLFGIQLDSLCDVVAFGAFPGLLCYCLGVRGSLGMLLLHLRRYQACFFQCHRNQQLFLRGRTRKGLPRSADYIYCGNSAAGISASLCSSHPCLYSDSHGHALWHRRSVYCGLQNEKTQQQDAGISGSHCCCCHCHNLCIF